MTFGELQESVDRVLGVHLPLTPPEGDGPQMLRRLTGRNSRLAERFRAGRVLLVGDAAHVHSAIGGPGLNLGLQDAVNLGWKLAAELQGWAPEGLLDTYESERRPVAQRVVMQTQAQSALIAPGNEVTALRELFAELLAEPRNVKHVADLITGADIRYCDGPHPLIGRWAPDLDVSRDGEMVRLAELTRAARPLLLDFTEDAAYAAEATIDRVDVVVGQSEQGPRALLIRPDGYVGWAAESSEQLQGLRDALATWFGVRQGRDLTKTAR